MPVQLGSDLLILMLLNSDEYFNGIKIWYIFGIFCSLELTG